jgi:hypothetical protein
MEKAWESIGTKDDSMASKNQRLPNFIGIGAQRAGTTWLNRCLRDHPSVFVAEKKELHFFDREFTKGLGWYAAAFKDAPLNSVIGEFTPNYYHDPLALERIKNSIPQVKLIFIARNPVDRSFSQYQLYSEGVYQGLTFQEALREDKTLIEYSLQGKHLERALSLFPKEQILILLYEELSSSPLKVIGKVCRFLGVDDQFTPPTLNKRVNRVVLPNLQAQLNGLKLGWIIPLVKKTPLADWIKERFHQKTSEHLKRSELRELTMFFYDDVSLLERITEQDLTNWKKL